MMHSTLCYAARGATLTAMSNIPTVIVKTSELREGDVVRAHGLRMLIDQPIRVSTCHEYHEHRGHVLCTRALVITPERIEDIEDSMLRMFVRQDGGRWGIQGNDLATWCVERPIIIID